MKAHKKIDLRRPQQPPPRRTPVVGHPKRLAVRAGLPLPRRRE